MEKQDINDIENKDYPTEYCVECLRKRLKVQEDINKELVNALSRHNDYMFRIIYVLIIVIFLLVTGFGIFLNYNATTKNVITQSGQGENSITMSDRSDIPASSSEK